MLLFLQCFILNHLDFVELRGLNTSSTWGDSSISLLRSSQLLGMHTILRHYFPIVRICVNKIVQILPLWLRCRCYDRCHRIPSFPQIFQHSKNLRYHRSHQFDFQWRGGFRIPYGWFHYGQSWKTDDSTFFDNVHTPWKTPILIRVYFSFKLVLVSA